MRVAFEERFAWDEGLVVLSYDEQLHRFGVLREPACKLMERGRMHGFTLHSRCIFDDDTPLVLLEAGCTVA